MLHCALPCPPWLSCRSLLNRLRFGAAIAALHVGGAIAAAQVEQGDLSLDLEPVVTGLVAPALLTHAGDSSGRLFVCDQVGKIRIIQNGVLLPTPFLDLKATGDVVNVNPGYDERGLLGLAFHPNYAVNGRFFVRYSKSRTGVAGEPCFGTGRGCHTEILAEYHVSAGDPNVASPVGTVLLAIDKPQFNHDSGDIVFGPDGYLYMGMGDGGGANDGLADVPPSHGPIGNAQNTNSLMGKVLRLDVNSGSPYSIPASNPFAGGGGLGEIFAYGFRNPYRFAFDDGPGGTGQLIVADVGQNLYEEVDLVTNGGNYGWVKREGKHCFDPFNPNTSPPSCDTTGLIDPVAEFDHTVGIAVVGGFVYRGAWPPVAVGKYIFADFSTAFTTANGHMFYIDTAQDWSKVWRVRLGADNHALSLFVKGMGRDQDGELYLLTSTTLGPSGTSGAVWHIAVRCPADFDRNGYVNGDDFDGFMEHWVLGDDFVDFDHNTFVNGDDFDGFTLAFYYGC